MGIKNGTAVKKLAADVEVPLLTPGLLAKILGGTALAGFGIRGAVGLARMLGRRAKEYKEKTEPETFTPATKLSSEKSAEGFQDVLDNPITGGLLATLAGGGGAYGGWRLADYLFEKRHIAELEHKIRKAKKEYEHVLLGRPSSVELRIPKTAEFVDRMATVYDQDGAEAMNKEARSEWQYAASAFLSAILLNAAHKSYLTSKKTSEPERRLEALTRYMRRPRRPLPARAELSQPRPTAVESQMSATPLRGATTAEKLDEDELFKDPTRKSAAAVLLGV